MYKITYGRIRMPKKKCKLCRKGFTPQDKPIYVEFYKSEVHENCLKAAKKLFERIKSA